MSERRDQSRIQVLPFAPRSERETIAADARHVVHLDPPARAAGFVSLEQTLEAVLTHVPPAERRRRRLAAKLVDPLPHPWWKHLRRTEWPTDNAAT